VPNLPGQGAITRKGAAWLKHVDELDRAGIRPRTSAGKAAAAWREAAGLGDGDSAETDRPGRLDRPDRSTGRPPTARRPSFAERVLADDDEVVVVHGDADGATDVRDVAAGAVRRGSASRERGSGPAAAGRPGEPVGDLLGEEVGEQIGAIEDEVRAELARAVPKQRLARSEARLADAARAFQRERFGDAARILKKLSIDAPGVASVHELYGLTLYRQGKWRSAAKELEAFRLLGGSVEQHPVLADCYRALRRWAEVDRLWDELKAASPSAELVVEGRIVAAGARADRGDVAGGIALLEQGWKLPKRPREHHLRRAYALADLYERGGEVARARELFQWIARSEPDFADARRRARLVGG
jgi:hypothetical protein